MIKGRPRASPTTGFLLSAVFACAMTFIVTADQLVSESAFVEGDTAPITMRVPHFGGLRDDDSRLTVAGGSIVVARGDMIGPTEAQIIATIYSKRPRYLTGFVAYACAFFLMALLYTSYLRRSPRGRLFRMQAVSMGLTVGLAVMVKLLLMLTTLSVLIVPAAAAAVIAAVAVDLYGALATALVVGISVALAAPFDPGVVGVLAVQGVATVLCVGESRKKLTVIGAGALGGVAAAATYVVFFYLSSGDAPVHELQDPLRSAWLASFAGGALSGIIAVFALPVYQWLLGEITSSKLVELSDLSNPLLKQIAEKSPGTWQHSLAMANMAEIAANTIGANGRLVRVGAYYHDLGKSLQPKYYIENVGSDEKSPHDALPPEVSCDAIFSHVTEGVRLARKEGLPERVVDFMHMHHGDGLLEYFWGKCQEQGNPQGLTADDFRYPGVRPQTRETAILAICDAVEAASRTLKQPDARAIENLVQRIVYGKLHLGQLDDSGLSMSDLRMLSNSLIQTIKHAHHVRVEYPWQREERERQAREAAESEQATVAASPRAVAAQSRATTSQRIGYEPPLDSLDFPRRYWRSSRAKTPVPLDSVTVPERPDTDPEAVPEETDGGDETAPGRIRTARPDAVTEPPPLIAKQELKPAPRAKLEPLPGMPEPQPEPEPEPAPKPKPKIEPVDEDEVAESVPTTEMPAQADPHARNTRPVEVQDEPEPEPQAPPPEGKGPMASTLLGTGAQKKNGGPPPPPKKRKPRSTVELMKGDDNGAESPLATGLEEPSEAQVESHRANTDDGLLEPGVMVVGPPPKTRSGTKTDDD